MTIYLSLIWEFIKTGLFAIGGGLAALPFITDIGQRTGWYTTSDIANMIAVAESCPGPLGVNMATYAGYITAEALVHRLFERIEINPQMQAASKDAKTALQEWLQARKMKPPQYHVVATLGEAHRQTFEVECAIAALGLSARGTGASRRAGEQAAAAALLTTLKAQHR